MTQPNLANIRAWVDALRSGRYEQGHGRLLTVADDVKRFCCLGVACDISGLGHWDDYLCYRVGGKSRFELPSPAGRALPQHAIGFLGRQTQQLRVEAEGLCPRHLCGVGRPGAVRR
jgi:hypothetical protein